ncbi:MAG: DUF1501 domain-containing protein [Myxococcales bacterium]|nr:DUF1501 domain-containing protein [Myxococcales bacterium]
MHRVHRRRILTAGAGAGLSLLLSRWLERHALADGPAAPPARATSIIVLWMNGGPSHIDTWDPKTGKTGGSHKSIATSVPGLRISEHMPQLAKVANKLAVVRGMTSKEGNHQRAQYLLRTGYSPNPTVSHPSLGAWMSLRRGAVPNGLPPFVSLGGPSVGGGFFGVQHGPFVAQPPGAAPPNVAYGPFVDAERFEARRKLLADADARFAKETGDVKVEGRRAVYEQAYKLMHSAHIKAFDVSEEPASVRAAFGDAPFGQGCLAAVRLVAAGVRFVEVTLDGWDTHQDNFGRTKRLMGTLDPAMSHMLLELGKRGLLDHTLVVWMGDFGRTPRINGNDGRDHYPAAWSAVLAGAGVRGGVVHGATDAEGAKVVRDPVRVPDLLATIATIGGLDPHDTAMSPAGRPISLTDGGTPVRELLAP